VLGFGVALLALPLLWLLVRGSGRRAGALLFALVTVFAVIAYWGWVRRTTGQSDAWLASPSAMIDDARRAVDQVKQRQAERDELIRRIQREAQ
jgi:membrane protein implicated in regulation of membrane protease activity